MNVHRLHSSKLISWEGIDDYFHNRKDWFVQDKRNPVLSSVETVTCGDGSSYYLLVNFYRRRMFDHARRGREAVTQHDDTSTHGTQGYDVHASMGCTAS